MLEDRFRDLAPLDPAADGARWERMVGGVMSAAAPELRRRSALPAAGTLLLLSGWLRPAAGAAALASVAAAVVAFAIAPASIDPSSGDLLAAPGEIAAWMESDVPPSVEDLAALLEGAR